MAAFTNQATLSYNNLVTTSNIVQGELVETLTAAKTPIESNYQSDEVVTYAISLVNAGTTAFTGLTITDNLGAYAYNAQTLVPMTYVDGSITYFANGVLQTAPAVTAGPPLTISGVSVPAGGNAVIVYSARINQFAPLGEGGTIDNSAVITGGGLTAPLTATAQITAEAAPQLSLVKAVNPTSVVENEPVTYTFTIQNTGTAAATAADNLVISDTFNPILNITAVTLGGTALAPTTGYTYNATSGAFATVAGQITVPAATYARDAATGAWVVTPGTATLTVTGTM